MVCFKRPPNLKDLLCRAKLPPKRTYSTRIKKPGARRCNKPSCRMCPFMDLERGEVRESITIAHSGETIPIKSAMDCQTSNLIYEVRCLKEDSVSYFGETSKSAETRITQHLNTIIQQCHTNTSAPVGRHFRATGHDPSNLRATPFEKIYSRNPFIRKVRETSWIMVSTSTYSGQFISDPYQLSNCEFLVVFSVFCHWVLF